MGGAWHSPHHLSPPRMSASAVPPLSSPGQEEPGLARCQEKRGEALSRPAPWGLPGKSPLPFAWLAASAPPSPSGVPAETGLLLPGPSVGWVWGLPSLAVPPHPSAGSLRLPLRRGFPSLPALCSLPAAQWG